MSAAAACEGAVVVVEDEPDTRELMQELLESRGHRVVTAEDGVAAVDLLRRLEPVCIVLLDLLMPRLDGFGVLDAIASDPRLSKLPVFVTTSAPDRVPAGLRCLPKPVDMEQLFTLVDAYCAGEPCTG